MKRNIGALLVLLGLGCGGSDGLSTELEGVYTVTTWTENETDCASEGPSVPKTNDRAAYIKMESVFGVSYINFVMCSDVTACAMQATEDSISLGGIAFERGNDTDGWLGATAILGGAPGEACDGAVERHTLSASGETISVRTERVSVEGVARDADGFCHTDAAVDAADGRPCEKLEVITAAFAQAF